VKSRALSQALLLIALAFLPAIGQAIYFRDKVSWQSPVPSGESVTVAQARAWGADAIWVDARPEEEFARDHVPGAILLNEDHWNDLLPHFLGEKWSPDKKIVVYCSTKSCNLAREVARRLREEVKLPNDIRVLDGGWEEWLKERK
jgi:rhodanese-related sulfurtransferase